MSKKQRTLFQAWSQTMSKKTFPVDTNTQNQILITNNVAKVLHNFTSVDNLHENNTNYTECLPGFDMDAGKTWIFPVNMPIRDYQFSIVKEVLFKNTMVVLPTGLGKTFIAAVVMYNLYRWYPDGKVVFMAPTRPLVAQQRDACFQITGISQNDIIQMTGTNTPAERKHAWLNKRVFFLTPQTLSNDIARNICPSEKIKCLVVDEAHKALGNHAYCEVIRQLLPHSSQFRVLALTATPGSDILAVKQVIANLLISHLELRTEDSEDVLPYTHARNIEKIVVPLGDELFSLKSNFLDIINVYIKRLVQRKAFSSKNPALLSKFQIIKLREIFNKNPPQGLDKRSFGLVIADFALCISLYHAYELLLHHGIKPFYQFLMGVMDGEKSIPHARSELKKNLDFEKMMMFIKDNYFPENKCAQGIAQVCFGSQRLNETQEFVAGHPKLNRLEKIVLTHFQNVETDATQTRIIIFSQYRDSVKEIEQMLKRHYPIVKVMSFLGQATKTGTSKGVSQKQQLKVIQDFREGGYNTLVSTCVGEEGLDIGEVDLIICYDCPKSPIRLVQRIGRTGRKRKGRIVMLVTEGKEEQMYNSSEKQKKTIFRALKTGFSFAEFYQESPRMVPRGLQPVCIKSIMTIEPKVAAKVKKKSKSEKGSSVLNEQEKLYFERSFKVPESQIPVLPAKFFLTLPVKINAAENEDTSRKNISLNGWLPWQSTLQRTYMVSHSSKTSILVDVLQLINHPETLSKYGPCVPNRLYPQIRKTSKSNTLNCFLTKNNYVSESRDQKKDIINMPTSLADKVCVVVEKSVPIPKISEKQYGNDFLTFVTSMITESKLVEASNTEDKESFSCDFSFLGSTDFLQTSFENINNIGFSLSSTKISKISPEQAAAKANILSDTHKNATTDRYRIRLNGQKSDVQDTFAEKSIVLKDTKEMFHSYNISTSIESTLASELFNNFAVPVPKNSYRKSESTNLAKKHNSLDSFSEKRNSFYKQASNVKYQPLHSVTEREDKFSDKMTPKYGKPNWSTCPAANASCHKNWENDWQDYYSAPLFNDEVFGEETIDLELIGASNYFESKTRIEQTNQVLGEAESNVITKQNDVNGESGNPILEQTRPNFKKNVVSEVSQLNTTTQYSLTQLASLVDSTQKVLPATVTNKTEMKVAPNSPSHSESDEEICPTPPKDNTGSGLLFSYKSSQLKISPVHINSFGFSENSIDQYFNCDNSVGLLEGELSQFSVVCEKNTNKELIGNTSKDVKSSFQEKVSVSQLQNTSKVKTQNVDSVQEIIPELNTTFDLSFDVDFTQENVLSPLSVEPTFQASATKSIGNNLSLKAKSQSETQLKKFISLKKKSKCTSDTTLSIIKHVQSSDDDDFIKPKRLKTAKDTKKHFKRPKKIKFNQNNSYIFQEAEVSDANGSDDESEGSDLDQLDESFIDDNTICHNQIEELGCYLKSVRNYRGPQPQYKLKFTHPAIDVFSQPVDNTPTDYMLDSFCVDDDNITFLSSSDNESPEKKIARNPKMKRKRIMLVDSNSSSDDKTPHKLKKVEVGSPFRKNPKTFDKPKPCIKPNSIFNDQSRNLVYTRKADENSKSPPVIDITSSPEHFEDNEVKSPLKSCKTTDSIDSIIQVSKNRALCEDITNISFDVGWDDPLEFDGIPEPTFNVNKSDIAQKTENVKIFENSIIDIPKYSAATSVRNNSMSRPPPKPNAFAHNLKTSSDIIAPNIVIPENNSSKLSNLDNSTVNHNPKNLNRNLKSSNSTSNILILVSTRELPSSKMISSFLRTNFGTTIIVMQLPDTDYIVSNRLAVLRIYDSDFLTVQSAAKVVKKVKATKELYEKCCIIIEKDSRKSFYGLNKDMKSHLEFSLTIIQHSSMKILHSETQMGSAKLLFELAEGEQKRNVHIDVPVNLNGHQQQLLYNFYTSLPHISPICALNFMYRFPNLQRFFQSSEDELKKAGYISSVKAHSIHWYLRANLKI